MEYGYHRDGTPKNPVWPKLMPKDELMAKTAEAYGKYFSSGVQILNRSNLEESLQQMSVALNGDSTKCFVIGETFGSDKWPENANPELAFQWMAYRQMQLDGYSESSDALSIFNQSKYLILIGTNEQKASAIQAMDEFAEMFCNSNGSWYWFLVAQYIGILAGVHPEKIFRTTTYPLNLLINKPRAIELYKRF